VDVTEYLINRKKVLQSEDNLKAEIADNDRVFKVNFRLSV